MPEPEVKSLFLGHGGVSEGTVCHAWLSVHSTCLLECLGGSQRLNHPSKSKCELNLCCLRGPLHGLNHAALEAPCTHVVDAQLGLHADSPTTGVMA